MFELFSPPKTVGFIPASLVSLLILPSPNQSVSCHQACAVSLRNAAPRGVIRGGIGAPIHVKASTGVAALTAALRYSVTDSCPPRGGGR